MDNIARKYPGPLQETESRPVTRRVFVRDLELPAHIGAFDSERGKSQTIRISIMAEMDAKQDSSDPLTGLDRVVRYDRLVKGIRDILAEGHYELAETLADRIAKMMLGFPAVRLAEVRIEKPEAIESAKGAGAEVVWQKGRGNPG